MGYNVYEQETMNIGTPPRFVGWFHTYEEANAEVIGIRNHGDSAWLTDEDDETAAGYAPVDILDI